MASMLGMDVAVVKQVAKQVENEANELQTKINAIGQKITNAPWVGPDQKKFVGDWNAQKAQVTRVVEMLKDTARKMEANAREQEATSNR